MNTPAAEPVFRRETLAAIEAVARALEMAEGRVGASDVSSKDGRDVVTGTDVAVEDAIRESLARLGLPVIGEERGGDVQADGSPYWLVDPICGTRNFASGTLLYCINLALIERGEVTAAAVGDPSRREVLVAELGRGAWVRRGGTYERIAVSTDNDTVVIEDGKTGGPRRAHAGRFMAATIGADRWDFRSLGTTLSFAYLAAGRVSAYAVFWVTAVHAAAGSFVAKEAGATLTDIEGAAWTLDSDSVLACATPALHEELLRMVRATA
jgi:myo-inositol-1(or 4)-monophosphatase